MKNTQIFFKNSQVTCPNILIKSKDLNPNYITGFIDGEGSFNIIISVDPTRTSGYRVVCEFHITQKYHSAEVLYAIKDYFNCGIIKVCSKQNKTLNYQINSFKDIHSKLIPFLDKNPLLTSKQLNYLTFKKAINMLINGEHLTIKGIEELKALAKEMNTNRTFEEKWNFTQNYCPTVKITPEWIAGFVDAEGCFYFYIGKQTLKGKESSTWLLNPSLEIAQNTHDTAVLELIKNYFNCGRIKPTRKDNSLEEAKSLISISRYIASNMTNITNVIIPFFDKYSLLTSKSLDYKDWKHLIELKLSKAHLDANGQGIEKMKQIKAGMNSNRVNFPPFKSVILNCCPNNPKERNTLDGEDTPYKVSED
jgi:hypothetical protein